MVPERIMPPVLIVDDHPRNLDALEGMLAPLDCQLIRATSADEALLALLRYDFAAIVLDIRMPGTDGLELARLIKQRRRSELVPIVFLTAYGVDDRDMLQGYGVGAVDYLSKPVHADILRSKIAVFIDLFTKTQALARLNETLENRVRERTVELVEARDEAQRQIRVKDEFLASLSHELRTPMNVILGWLTILESGEAVRDLQSTLAIIRRNAEIQARLIDDLLDTNRLISGRFHLEMTDVDMPALLQTTVQSLQPMADRKGVLLTMAVGDHLRAVNGDSRRLQQILWNLLHNAVKFTPGGGRVQIDLSQADAVVEIMVRDTGCGISPDFLPMVFERFRREDASPVDLSSGLGLGLAITKELVELHGGTIRADSEGPGAGATFVVRVPNVRADVMHHDTGQTGAPLRQAR
jgi:signal transduction histidine kinase